jgi:D-lactate dehydrogenase
MKVAVYDSQSFDREFLTRKDWEFGHDLSFFEAKLTPETAALALGHPCISCSVGDQLDGKTLPALAKLGVKLIALRSAGYNHVDLKETARLGLHVVRVPAYSPNAVAEHAAALLLALDRHIPKAYNRVRDLNFSLEGLMGFDLFEKTIGIIGTGKIGSVMAKIMNGFGCKVIAFDPKPDAKLEKLVTYVPLTELYMKSDIISLHVPLTPETRHLIAADALGLMKAGVYIINTGRGALIDTRALIAGLKTGHIGAAGLDVYEEEEGIFYQDLSDHVLKDDVLARLLTFPNVLVTSHQAFFTREAVTNIARTTLQNITDFQNGVPLKNEVKAETHLISSAPASKEGLTH